MKDNKKQKNDSDNDRFRKGLWSVEEDKMLLDYVNIQGKGHWNRVSKETGLKRSGKSCRLRWMNYLSPSVKRERFTEDEDDLIVRLHNLLGNRWALIAGRVPGRTDNQVKNYWNTHLSKKLHINKKTPANYCKPAIIDNHDHLPAVPTDDQIISSDFSTNTTSCAVRIETANKETKSVEESNTDVAQKSPQLRGPQADTFGQTETAAAADDDYSSWFIQYLDDYSLHFVLNSNHRNNAADGNST